MPKLNSVVEVLVATAQARDLDGVLIEVVVRYRLKVNLVAEILLSSSTDSVWKDLLSICWLDCCYLKWLD